MENVKSLLKINLKTGVGFLFDEVTSVTNILNLASDKLDELKFLELSQKRSTFSVCSKTMVLIILVYLK